MKTKNLLLLGIALGFIFFIIPLKFGQGRDPFDEGINYAIWMGGAFVSSLGLTVSQPKDATKWALCVAFGFPAAVIFDMLFSSKDYNLFPLTLLLSLFIGLIPAFTGAVFGKLIAFLSGKLGRSSAD